MDLISREQAIKKVRAVSNEWLTEMIYGSYLKGFIFGTDIAIQTIIHDVPSTEKTGKWEHYEHREPQYDIMGIKTWAEAYKCSNCGFIHSVIEDFGHYAYCPNCGAKMEVEG